jgi:hypothetical protein
LSDSGPDKNVAAEPNGEATDVDEGETLEWTVHPVRRKWWVSVVVTMFIAAVGATVKALTDSTGFTLLAVAILLLSLAKFYFPTKFKLSDRGVTVKTTTQTLFKEWKIYRSCYPDKKGILLSTFAEPSRLENFRGLYVMFEGNNDEVTAFVRERIKRAHEPAEGEAS